MAAAGKAPSPTAVPGSRRCKTSAWDQSNRLETLSSLAVRAIASAISGAIEMTRMLLATRTASVGWIVSVMTSSLSCDERDARDRAAGKHAVGDIGGDVAAPLLDQRVGGVASVPPESTMSSIRMQRAAAQRRR